MNKKAKIKLLKDIAAKKKKVKDLIPQKLIIRRRVIARNAEGELIVKAEFDRTVYVDKTK